MPTYTFNSADPDASALDVDHGPLGLIAERAMNHEAYTNRNHRLHYRAVSDARAALEAIYGDEPANGGQPFCGQTINSATGEVIDSNALTNLYRPGEPDEYNKV